MTTTNQSNRVAYIVDGLRTPFLRMQKTPGEFSAADLAVNVGRDLLARQTFQPQDLDEIIMGCVMPSPDEANIARIIALRLGCGDNMPAWTVQRNCASGLQAVDSAVKDIVSGRHDLVLAGGAEAMTHAPLLLKPKMVVWLGDWSRAKSFSQKLKLLATLRPADFSPIVALLRGLRDPLFDISMGQTAEKLAYRFNITREMMDEYAAESHRRLATAQDSGFLAEISPLFATNGRFYEEDNGLRRDSSAEKLAKLRPVFDRKYGAVTAGNSSQITDGAAMLLIASEAAVKRHNLTVLAKVVDTEWAALDPTIMGLGPIHAATPLLQRHGLRINDIDYWEINEAFAAQVLACKAAWQDDEYCQKNFGGLGGKFGDLDLSRVNIDGGAIALGHPIGASGARVVLHMVHTLKRQNARRGVASLCIGGGQGGAILIERES